MRGIIKAVFGRFISKRHLNLTVPVSLKQRLGLELYRKLRHNSVRIHQLRSLFWECTLRCNMNCRHCGSDCRQQSGVSDMPAADFLRVIDSITPHVYPNETFVIFTGGEALLRPDIEEVGLQLYRRGYPWGMVTNGYLLDEQRLASLMAGGMHSITVSLDGFDADHNWIRRNDQSFARAEHAIQLLARQRELVWDVVTCVNPRNIGSLDSFKSYLEGLGVRYWRVFTIFPMGRAAQNPDLQLSDDQFREVFEFIERQRVAEQMGKSRMHVNYGCEGFVGDYEGRVRDHYFFCRAGIEVASILADGSISGCTSIRSNFHQGNIYRDDFWKVWQNGFEPYRNRQWAHKDACAGCKMWRYCEGSGMHLYDDNGQLLFCHYHRLGNQ